MRINIKIRRLQGPDINIEIDDQAQIIDLKKCIESKAGLESDLQRLIFYGQVLKNEKKLKDYNIQDDVVVHMVQNIPIDPTTIYPEHGQTLGVIPDITITYDNEELSPTAIRLRSLRTIVNEIRVAICALDTEDDDEIILMRNLSSSNPVFVFADILAELHYLDSRFVPHRETYLKIIKNANKNLSDVDEMDFNGSMSFVDRASQIYHSFGHAYHIISDIFLMVSRQGAVLTSELFSGHRIEEHDNRISEVNQNNETLNLEVVDPITIQVQIEARVPMPGIDSDNNANRNPAEAQADQRTGPESNPTTQVNNANSQETRNPDSEPQPWNPTQTDIDDINREFETPAYVEHGFEMTFGFEDILQLPFSYMNSALHQIEGTDLEYNNSSQNIESEAQLEVLPPETHSSQTSDSRDFVTGSDGGYDIGLSSARQLRNLQRLIGDSNILGGSGQSMYVAQVPLGEQPVDIIQHIVSSVFRNGLQDGDWHVINPDTESFSTPTSQTMSYANTRITPGADTGPAAPLATADPALEEAFFGAPQISISDESENESDEADETNPTISFDQQLRYTPHQRRTVPLSNVVFDETMLCESRHNRRSLQSRSEVDPCEFPSRFNDASSSRAYNAVLSLYHNLQDNPDRTIISCILLLREAIVPGPCRFLHTDQLRRVGDVLQTYLRSLMEGEDNNTIERLADGVIEMHKHFFKTILPQMIIWPIDVDIYESLRATLRHYMKGILRLLSIRAPDDFCRTVRTFLPVVFHDLCQVLYYAIGYGGNFFSFAGRRFLVHCLTTMTEMNRDLILQPAFYCLAMARHRLINNSTSIDRFIVNNLTSDECESLSPQPSTSCSLSDDAEQEDTTTVEYLTPGNLLNFFSTYTPTASTSKPVVTSDPYTFDLDSSGSHTPESHTPESLSPESLSPESLTPESLSPEPLSPERLSPEPLTPEPLTSEPLTSEPLTPERLTPEPLTPEPLTPESLTSEMPKPEILMPESLTSEVPTLELLPPETVRVKPDRAVTAVLEQVVPASPALPQFSTQFGIRSAMAQVASIWAPIASTSDFSTSMWNAASLSSIPETQGATSAPECFQSATLNSLWSPEDVDMMNYDMAVYMDRPPLPFSDAYISGMTPREQVAAREDRPPADINSFIEDVLNILGEGVEIDSRMRNIFIPFLRDAILNRRQRSADADALRFVALHALRNSTPTDEELERLRAEMRRYRMIGPRS